MRSAPKRKAVSAGLIASAIATSVKGMAEIKIGPDVRPLDLDVIGTLLSQPAWGKIGLQTRLAFAVLRSETRGADLAKTVAELLEEKEGEPYEDTLVKMSQARIALLEIAMMLKVSLRKQWSAVDTYLIAQGLPPTRADDELCGDDDLLALRPAFEAGRARMKAATDALAEAEELSKADDDPRLIEADAEQGAAIDGDRCIVARVAAIRARTKEGIRFKRQVRQYWDGCQQPELDASIFADLLAYVEASP